MKRVFPVVLVLVASAATARAGLEELDVERLTQPIADADFGVALASDGNRLVVGAPRGLEPSAIHIYEHAAGSWTHVQSLDAPAGAAGKGFGLAIALSGDTLVAGVQNQNCADGVDCGAAYVYQHGPGGFVLDATLESDVPTRRRAFGQSVDIEGDLIAISDPDAWTPTPGAGEIHLFRRAAGVWSREAILQASDARAGGALGGGAIDLDGDALYVGDDDRDCPSSTPYCGGMYAFERVAGTWTETALVLPSDLTNLSGFGSAIDAEDGEIYVLSALGRPAGSEGCTLNCGAIHRFNRTSAGVYEEAEILTSSRPWTGVFYRVLDRQDDWLLVHSGGHFVDGASSKSATLFERSGGVWTERGRVQSPDLGVPIPPLFSIPNFGRTLTIAAGELVVSELYDPDVYSFEIATFDNETCVSDTECPTGHCVDGVCCNEACGDGATDDCVVCSVAAGGEFDGSCGPLVPSAPPVECNPSGGACDPAERCFMLDEECPPDNGSSPGVLCRPAVGPCDVLEVCDGSETCPPDMVASAGTSCRSSTGACDPEESCDGSSTACPTDSVEPVGTVCRAASGACDVADRCNGIDGTCTDEVEPLGTTCRASVGACDIEETCTGASPACPTDSVVASGTVCAVGAGPCDVDDTCDGVSGICASIVASAGTLCRSSSGACDLEDICDGLSTSCSDEIRAAGSVCRSAAGPCDSEETCDGTSLTCPPDSFANGITCRASTGSCDAADVCDGSGAACPDDAAEDGAACDDGSACTSSDQCVAGSCIGTSLDCDDADVCTVDRCEEGLGCLHTREAGCCTTADDCDDGDDRTFDECIDGFCSNVRIDAGLPDAGMPDSGPELPDATPGSDAGVEVPVDGCGCTSSNGAPSPLGVYLVIAWWLQRRRTIRTRPARSTSNR